MMLVNIAIWSAVIFAVAVLSMLVYIIVTLNKKL